LGKGGETERKGPPPGKGTPAPKKPASLLGGLMAKRAQKKEEERLAKQKKQQMESELKSYDELYGQKATQQALESKGEDYDPDEDFW
jgi:hypothetical protein